eukprot:gene17847-24234_t
MFKSSAVTVLSCEFAPNHIRPLNSCALTRMDKLVLQSVGNWADDEDEETELVSEGFQDQYPLSPSGVLISNLPCDYAPRHVADLFRRNKVLDIKILHQTGEQTTAWVDFASDSDMSQALRRDREPHVGKQLCIVPATNGTAPGRAATLRIQEAHEVGAPPEAPNQILGMIEGITTEVETEAVIVVVETGVETGAVIVVAETGAVIVVVETGEETEEEACQGATLVPLTTAEGEGEAAAAGQGKISLRREEEGVVAAVPPPPPSLQGTGGGPAPPSRPMPSERPKLVLAPRTSETKAGASEVGESASAAPAKPKSNPFGNARPVDTAARLKEIEEKQARKESVGDEAPVDAEAKNHGAQEAADAPSLLMPRRGQEAADAPSSAVETDPAVDQKTLEAEAETRREMEQHKREQLSRMQPLTSASSKTVQPPPAPEPAQPPPSPSRPPAPAWGRGVLAAPFVPANTALGAPTEAPSSSAVARQHENETSEYGQPASRGPMRRSDDGGGHHHHRNESARGRGGVQRGGGRAVGRGGRGRGRHFPNEYNGEESYERRESETPGGLDREFSESSSMHSGERGGRWGGRGRGGGHEGGRGRGGPDANPRHSGKREDRVGGRGGRERPRGSEGGAGADAGKGAPSQGGRKGGEEKGERRGTGDAVHAGGAGGGESAEPAAAAAGSSPAGKGGKGEGGVDKGKQLYKKMQQTSEVSKETKKAASNMFSLLADCDISLITRSPLAPSIPTPTSPHMRHGLGMLPGSGSARGVGNLGPSPPPARHFAHTQRPSIAPRATADGQTFEKSLMDLRSNLIGVKGRVRVREGSAEKQVISFHKKRPSSNRC